MAKIDIRPNVELQLVIRLTEEEARALDALVGYGFEPFIQAFYEKLGEAYMKSHSNGLKTFFESVQSFMPGLLSRADDARKAFSEKPQRAD